MIGGLFLMLVISIIVAISNNNKNKKYIKDILKDPERFKEKCFEEYSKYFTNSDIPEEDENSLEVLNNLIDSHIKCIKNGKKYTFDEFMSIIANKMEKQ
jgi:hypothetical protein